MNYYKVEVSSTSVYFVKAQNQEDAFKAYEVLNHPPIHKENYTLLSLVTTKVVAGKG
jgi:hypothetical protein